MRDSKNAAVLLFGDAREKRHHRVSVLAVESRSRLVGEDDRGFGGDGTGNGHTLLLTAREVARVIVKALAEPHFTQHFLGAARGLIALAADDVEGDANVLERSQRREQIVGLEDEAYVLAAHFREFFRREAARRLSLDENVARGRRENTASIESSVVLPLPEGPMRSVNSPGTSDRFTPLTARPCRRRVQLFHDGFCFEDGSAHRLNTIAGSIFVTLMMAEIAEMPDMKSVRPNSARARPGVITRGKGDELLKYRMVMDMTMPSP